LLIFALLFFHFHFAFLLNRNDLKLTTNKQTNNFDSNFPYVGEYQVFKAGPQFLALKDHAAFKKNVETLGVALYKMESGDKKKSFDW